jgi:hypothetical protein
MNIWGSIKYGEFLDYVKKGKKSNPYTGLDRP